MFYISELKEFKKLKSEKQVTLSQSKMSNSHLELKKNYKHQT